MHVYGPALVLAGPGSGKTTVIVARTIFLLEYMQEMGKTRNEAEGADGGNILTVAFNRAASVEMAERFKKLYQKATEKAHFSTFHSFCNKIICDYEDLTAEKFTRVAEDDEDNSNSMVFSGSQSNTLQMPLKKSRIVTDLYFRINNQRLSEIEANKLINELSCIKNGMSVEAAMSGSAFKRLDKVAQQYEEYKKENKIIDYDDMLFFAKDILEEAPVILRKIRSKYKFIQVDEGQDLSEIQMKILKLIARPGENNVFIVGDDDQGIYGFRGAKPECILEIEEFFMGCTIHRLERNYRSTKRIVELAGSFVLQNEKRYDKKHFTRNDIGEKPCCRVFYDDNELMAFLYSKVGNKNCGTCGILFRNGISSILPAAFLYNKGLDFSVGKLRDSFFDHWMVRDLTEQMGDLASKGDKSRPSGYLRRLFDDEGYMEKAKIKSELLFQPVETLDRIRAAIDMIARGSKTWQEILDKIKELEGIFKGDKERRADIHLSTVHAAKGLEYDTVFMVDLYKGEFPGKNSDIALEEERRLFFVGMTRARKRLYMVYPSKRAGRELEAGQFFKEAKALLRK